VGLAEQQPLRGLIEEAAKPGRLQAVAEFLRTICTETRRLGMHRNS